MTMNDLTNNIDEHGHERRALPQTEAPRTARLWAEYADIKHRVTCLEDDLRYFKAHRDIKPVAAPPSKLARAYTIALIGFSIAAGLAVAVLR
jgi:hypothetical protein